MPKEQSQNAKTRAIDATILFADMVDSSMLSHVQSPAAYDDLVSEYQKTAGRVISETVTKETFLECTPHVEVSVRGDELCLILGCTKGHGAGCRPQCHPNLCAQTVLRVAIRLKREWLLSNANKKRICIGQPPLGVAIGIHAGPVVVKKHTRFAAGNAPLPSEPQQTVTAEGYAINTAKRVETESRKGRFSRIFLTRPIYNRTQADFRPAFVRFEATELKGIPVAPVIYEAKGIGHFDDKCFPDTERFRRGLEQYSALVETNPDEVWLLLDLAHWYFDEGNYEEAARRYKAVLEADSSFAPAQMYLGRAHFRNYRMPEAHAALQRSLQLDQSQARANHFYAVCLRREALTSLYEGQWGMAKELFKRSIEHHQTACRIVDLEDMVYPWAENGLIHTVAQSYELEAHDHTTSISSTGVALIRPYDLDGALSAIEDRLRDLPLSVTDTGKQHLLKHTRAVVLLERAVLSAKQEDHDVARDAIQEAIDELGERNKDKDMRPDDKAYSDKLAEMLFHRGRCALLREGLAGIKKAGDDWSEAKAVLLKPWEPADQQRVIYGQYWTKFPLTIPGISHGCVADFLEAKERGTASGEAVRRRTSKKSQIAKSRKKQSPKTGAARVDRKSNKGMERDK